MTMKVLSARGARRLNEIRLARRGLLPLNAKDVKRLFADAKPIPAPDNTDLMPTIAPGDTLWLSESARHYNGSLALCNARRMFDPSRVVTIIGRIISLPTPRPPVDDGASVRPIPVEVGQYDDFAVIGCEDGEATPHVVRVVAASAIVAITRDCRPVDNLGELRKRADAAMAVVEYLTSGIPFAGKAERLAEARTIAAMLLRDWHRERGKI